MKSFLLTIINSNPIIQICELIKKKRNETNVMYKLKYYMINEKF